MKRFIDLVFAILLLPFLLLVTVFVAAFILIFNHYSPFYIQERLGKNRKKFYCFKFQCFRPAKDESEVLDKKRDKERLTRLGDFLRNRGIDELPQILNIISGSMSFVGPRPYLEKNFRVIEDLNQEILKDVKDWERKRLMVRPGLSGWHQIHSPGSKVIQYDMEYLEDPSFMKHIKVFLVSTLILIVGKKYYFNKIKF